MSDGERLAAAWRSDLAWLADFVASVTRDLSKTGDLGAYDKSLRAVSPYLSVEEICAFYRRLQESLRSESEWQQEFLSIFPSVTATDLPAPLVDEETMREHDEQADREFKADVTRAWQSNPRWRLNLLVSARDELSRTGGLSAYERVWRSLSPRLTKDEIITIYQGLQQSGRPESQWTEAFLGIFPNVTASDLPLPIMDE